MDDDSNGNGGGDGRGGDSGNVGVDSSGGDEEGGNGEEGDDKAGGQYQLWSRSTDSLKHQPGPAEYQKIDPVTTRCLELGACSKPQGSDFWHPCCFAVHQS